jgi:hypothetical protein
LLNGNDETSRKAAETALSNSCIPIQIGRNWYDISTTIGQLRKRVITMHEKHKKPVHGVVPNGRILSADEYEKFVEQISISCSCTKQSEMKLAYKSANTKVFNRLCSDEAS